MSYGPTMANFNQALINIINFTIIRFLGASTPWKGKKQEKKINITEPSHYDKYTIFAYQTFFFSPFGYLLMLLLLFPFLSGCLLLEFYVLFACVCVCMFVRWYFFYHGQFVPNKGTRPTDNDLVRLYFVLDSFGQLHHSTDHSCLCALSPIEIINNMYKYFHQQIERRAWRANAGSLLLRND